MRRGRGVALGARGPGSQARRCPLWRAAPRAQAQPVPRRCPHSTQASASASPWMTSCWAPPTSRPPTLATPLRGCPSSRRACRPFGTQTLRRCGPRRAWGPGGRSRGPTRLQRAAASKLAVRVLHHGSPVCGPGVSHRSHAARSPRRPTAATSCASRRRSRSPLRRRSATSCGATCRRAWRSASGACATRASSRCGCGLPERAAPASGACGAPAAPLLIT